MQGKFGVHTRLDTKVVKFHSPSSNPVRWFRLPGGFHLLSVKDRAARVLAPDLNILTNLTAHHFDGDGALRHVHDLGDGSTTNLLAIALASETASAANGSASTATVLNTANMKYMCTGTGGTANSYDYKLVTQDGVAAVAATFTFGLSGQYATMQWVGTLSYTGSEAVTEWGLSNQSGGTAAIATASSPSYTATSSTGFTGLTANADINYVLVNSTAPAGGVVISNTATQCNINAWANLNATGGTATTPSSGTTTLQPLLLDHLTFGAINVVNGDSIQFTFTMTLQSGG